MIVEVIYKSDDISSIEEAVEIIYRVMYKKREKH